MTRRKLGLLLAGACVLAAIATTGASAVDPQAFEAKQPSMVTRR